MVLASSHFYHQVFLIDGEQLYSITVSGLYENLLTFVLSDKLLVGTQTVNLLIRTEIVIIFKVKMTLEHSRLLDGK